MHRNRSMLFYFLIKLLLQTHLKSLFCFKINCTEINIVNAMLRLENPTHINTIGHVSPRFSESNKRKIQLFQATLMAAFASYAIEKRIYFCESDSRRQDF